MQITNQWEETFELKVGDWVGFKCDVEQIGQVKEIQRRGALVVENKNGFEGEDIGGDTKVLIGFDHVWKENL
jgi:hypothetical protein